MSNKRSFNEHEIENLKISKLYNVFSSILFHNLVKIIQMKVWNAQIVPYLFVLNVIFYTMYLRIFQLGILGMEDGQ